MAEPLFDPEYGKAQWIRVADVFLIGPLMIWGGARAGGLLGLTLGGLGAATIVFNGRNWLRADRYRRGVERAERERTDSGLTA